jgi:hypothetical protein
MCPALPDSEYYGDSAPSRTDRSTVDPARTAPPDAERRVRTGTVPVFTHNSLDEGGAQLCPCGIATATPQHFTVASRTNIHMPTRKFPTPTISRGGCAPHPAHIHQIGAGKPLRDVVTLVPLVLLFVTLAEPTPSGSAGMSRLCQGCSHHPRHLSGSGCPQLHRPAATARRRRSPTPIRVVSASRRTWMRAKVQALARLRRCSKSPCYGPCGQGAAPPHGRLEVRAGGRVTVTS